MYPRLLEIPTPLGAIPINAYGFMLMLGFIAAGYVAIRRGKRDGIDGEFIIDLGVMMMIAGVIGARANYVFEYREQYNWALFDPGVGGLAWPGAALGVALPLVYALFLGAPNRRKAGRAIGAGWLVGVALQMLAGAILLGRFGHWAQHRDLYTEPHVGSPFGPFNITEGGLTFYGGLLLAGPLGLWYARKRGYSLLILGDLTLPVVALGLIFGRVGCFLNGCCFGAPVQGDIPWAICWPRILSPQGFLLGTPCYIAQLDANLVGFEAGRSLPVHPTQVYFAFANAAMFLLVSWYWYRRPSPGKVMALFGTVYSAMRFTLENWRGDNEYYTGHLTIAQLTGIGVFLGCLLWWFWLDRHPVPRPEPSPPPPV